MQTTSAPIPATGARPLPQRHTLAPLCNGRNDPTTRLGATEFVRATLTPDGPGTVHLDWRTGSLAVHAWGPGGDWLRRRVPALVGALDTPVHFGDPPPAIARAQRRHPELRLGASGTLYHDLLPTILAQRITGVEAVRQWQRLCSQLGDTAPGPFAGLRLPPAPERLVAQPSWWFHPLGVERSRAETLVTVAGRADHLWRWSGELGYGPLPVHELAARLAQLRGVGEWTIGVVLGTALGEPDAIAVGDYHLKNTVAWALAGEPRATDERMLELLEPFRGQRHRVVRLLALDGHRAPSFGPRQRILAMHRW